MGSVPFLALENFNCSRCEFISNFNILKCEFISDFILFFIGGVPENSLVFLYLLCLLIKSNEKDKIKFIRYFPGGQYKITSQTFYFHKTKLLQCLKFIFILKELRKKPKLLLHSSSHLIKTVYYTVVPEFLFSTS